MREAVHHIRSASIFCRTQGSGVPVVLLHGFGLDQRMWDDQVPALAERFTVIRYDLRGYGRSSLPVSGPYSHAEDLHDLLGALNARPAHVVGLSNGARIATRFAVTHPKAVRSLMLVDAALDGHVWSADWQERWATIVAAAKAGSLGRARRLWLDHPLFAPARAQPTVATRLAEMVNAYSGWHWQNSDPGTAPDPPVDQRLGQIHAPTSILVGERDLPDFHAIADTLAAAIPGAKRTVVPGAGHMCNMEAPATFNDHLAAFLRAH
jgi:pimeloyl-ACP methyl ester carboxylesterase